MAAPNRSCSWAIGTPGLAGEVTTGRWERELADGSVAVMMYSTCDNTWRWMNQTDGTGAPAPPPTPADLIPEAFARVEEMLPTPVLRINPADTHPQGPAFVQIETYFWVDQVVGQWSPVSATVSLRGLSLTLTATPRQPVIDTGNNNITTCHGPPPPYPASMPDDFPEGCGYTYRDSSAMSANGETFPVTGTIVWTTAWSATNGESGTLANLTTASVTRDIAVAEIQAIITDNG